MDKRTLGKGDAGIKYNLSAHRPLPPPQQTHQSGCYVGSQKQYLSRLASCADSCSEVRLCLKLYIESNYMMFLKLKEQGCLVDISLHPVTLALIRWLICPFKIVTICMEKMNQARGTAF